jgi:4-diphosphocytidyl-2-C-methyl-D-erythritol kinase
MIGFPNGKINIGLSVTEKRPDGFHNIETIMVPVEIHDVLEIIISPDNIFSLSTSGIKISGETNDNLVVKACELLKKDFDLPAVKIHLHKVIPIGAGLGGGSSDAAFTIKMVNKLFTLGLSSDQMKDYARKLGSDCPFFIENKAAFATGRGDEFEFLDFSAKGKFLMIVKPDIPIATAEAYSWMKPSKKENTLKELIKLPMHSWRNRVINDFEAEVMKKYGVVQMIRDELYEMGAIYVSMTGSGSAVYGIFGNPVNLLGHFQNHFVWSNFERN